MEDSEGVSIHASTFHKHFASFPLVDSDKNLPHKTHPKQKPKQKKETKMMKVHYQQKLQFNLEKDSCSMLR